MDVVAKYRVVGSFRGAAEICGVDAQTVKRIVIAWEAGELDDEQAGRRPVVRNTDVVRDLVAHPRKRLTTKPNEIYSRFVAIRLG